MTTRVLITSPKPNHEFVRVSIQNQDEAGNWYELFYNLLDEGDVADLYVYENQRLVVTELPK